MKTGSLHQSKQAKHDWIMKQLLALVAWRIKDEVYNTCSLLDLHISSYHTQPHAIIANNQVFHAIKTCTLCLLFYLFICLFFCFYIYMVVFVVSRSRGRFTIIMLYLICSFVLYSNLFQLKHLRRITAQFCDKLFCFLASCRKFQFHTILVTELIDTAKCNNKKVEYKGNNF